MKYKKGFTLIELLTVVAIIGVLSTLVMGALGGAMAKGRDSKRLSSIKQLQNALELRYNDTNTFPTSADVHLSSSPLAGVLVPTYIKSIPVDPTKIDPNGFRYTTANTNYFYAIRMDFETRPACFVCGGRNIVGACRSSSTFFTPA